MIGAIFSFALLLLSLFIVIKSSDYAIKYSNLLAESFRLPKYIIGFLIVAVISILPETFISINAALEGIPSLGLGTLFGSNVADLTLVFAIVVLASGRNLKVESKVIKDRFLYTVIIMVPIVFGLNGHYSRLEGISLIILGSLFYIYVLRDGQLGGGVKRTKFSFQTFLLLIVSMAALLIGAHFTVEYGVKLANTLYVDPIFIGMFIVGLGTVLPELFFSLRAAKEKNDGLALGDVLGTVIADATIVVGIVASISPFYFEKRLVYVTGMFMLAGIMLLMHLIKTGKALTKKEVFLLLMFYMVFVLTESYIGR